MKEKQAMSLTPTHVSVVDVDMPFWSMVWFMMKWAIATIPAIAIMAIVYAFIIAILGSALG